MKGINCSKILLRGKKKKVLSRVHVRSLEQRARNAHDQNEQTLHSMDFGRFFVTIGSCNHIMRIISTKSATQESEQITVVTRISTLGAYLRWVLKRSRCLFIFS